MSMLNGKATVPQPRAINVGNDLSMPPDLQLAAPTQTNAGYEPNPGNNAALNGTYDGQSSGLPGADKVVLAQMRDAYEIHGISKVNADGTEKKRAQLQKELKAAILAKKRLTNPNYGTIKNIRNIFSDQ
jgi:hypothetical protein